MNIDTRGIPILMMTVEETHDTELHGLESGADDFVSKSVDAGHPAAAHPHPAEQVAPAVLASWARPTPTSAGPGC